MSSDPGAGTARLSRLVLPLVLALLPAAAMAQTQAEDAAAILALPARGEAAQCMMLQNVRQSIPVGKDVILVQMGTNIWYRNKLAAPCPSMNQNRILTYRTQPGGLICKGDPMDVVDPVSRIRSGPCILGEFVPIDYSRGQAAKDQPAP
jgi:hypothetical protein